MARLPYVEPADASDGVREVLQSLPVSLNIFKMMAHAETSLRPLLALGGSILGQQKLDPRLRELAVLQVAVLTPGRYEWVQHVPIAQAVGASDASIEAIERGDLEAACFGAVERAVLRFSAEVVQKSAVTDAVFDDVKRHLSPREIVELILTCGFYMMMARLTEVTETEIDAAAGTKIIDAVPDLVGTLE